MTNAPTLHRHHFTTSPEVVVRAPGRINLMGDHTDYCGLPVLPMAVRQAVVVAASQRSEPGLHAVSALDDRMIGPDVGDDPLWAKYVRAVIGEVESLVPGRGVQLAIDSDLPSTGGLSSSSALSVGCLIAVNELWDLDLSAPELVATAVAAERKAAIAGGAMDQTVITLAEPGNALRIDFDPPAHRNVPVPTGFAWIAAFSGETAPKGDTATDAYNSFVLASRAAAALLGEQLGVEVGSPPLLSRVVAADAAAIAALPTVPVAVAAALSGGDDLELDPERPLDLAASARHVVAEAHRVDEAEKAMLAGDVDAMGRLMDDSHVSLGEYGSTTPALDRLVTAARSAGASGSRVTGAGFGGWAIALTGPGASERVRAAMESACGGPAFVATPEGGALWSLRA